MGLLEFLKPTSSKLMLFFIFATIYFYIHTVLSSTAASASLYLASVGAYDYSLVYAHVVYGNSSLNISEVNATFHDFQNQIGNTSVTLNNSRNLFNPLTSLLSFNEEPEIFMPFVNGIYISPSGYRWALGILVYWYILSCLIVYIYKKFRNQL